MPESLRDEATEAGFASYTLAFRPMPRIEGCSYGSSDGSQVPSESHDAFSEDDMSENTFELAPAPSIMTDPARSSSRNQSRKFKFAEDTKEEDGAGTILKEPEEPEEPKESEETDRKKKIYNKDRTSWWRKHDPNAPNWWNEWQRDLESGMTVPSHKGKKISREDRVRRVRQRHSHQHQEQPENTQTRRHGEGIDRAKPK